MTKQQRNQLIKLTNDLVEAGRLKDDEYVEAVMSAKASLFELVSEIESKAFFEGMK